MAITLTKSQKERILKEIYQSNTTTLRSLKEANSNFHWSFIYYEATGDSALHIASRLGHVDTIDYLLRNYKPCAVELKNKDDKTALHEAAQFSQFNSVLKLLSHGADVNALRRGDWTALMLACTKVVPESSLNIAKALVEQGAKINICNKDGWTCAHILAREQDCEIFEYLVSRGLNASRTTKNGRTALHIAVLHGNQLLLPTLTKFIDINCRDSCGNTPLHEAILGQHTKIAKWLIERGADISAKNNSDLSLLHLAGSQENVEVLSYVLHVLRFDINMQNRNGWTVAHCAARNKLQITLNYLKESGADFSIKDNLGRTCMDYIDI